MLAAGAFTASLSLSSAAAGSPSLNNAAHPKVSTLSPQYLFETPVSEGTGSLYGTVFDPNGAAIPGAVVTLINSESHQIVSAISDGEGAYRFSAVAVGIYSLKVAASGFEPNQVSMIKLNANDNNRLDQTLSVASINEVVEITAPSISVSGAMVVIPSEPIVKAAFADNIEEVKQALLKFDANVRDTTTEWTALECAVLNANREMVQLLVSSKADVNARDRSGQTVLMLLGEDVTSDLVWDLLNAGAKVNMRDKDGDTALIEAASVNNTEVLRTLLEGGAKVNVANDDGDTPLMKAAAEGLVNNIRVLIQAGAEINQRDKKGKSALSYAKAGDHRAAVRLLTSFGAMDFEVKEEP